MPLAVEAQRVIDDVASRMRVPMYEMSVEELRAAYSARAVPATTVIHEVLDLTVPSGTGGVPVRIYRPSADTSLPVVMWLHSGGCVIGGLDQNDEYLRKLSAAASVVIVSVDYRLAPEHPHPAALDDCRAVWEWLEGAPGELAADVDRVAVAGESAGGTLTFALTQQLRDGGRPLPTAQVSFYGAAEMRVSNPDEASLLSSPEDCHRFWDLYVPDVRSRLHPDVSPGLAADVTGLPPTFIVTAEVDPTRDATEDYARRMAASGVQVELDRYDGMMHGFATLLTALPQARRVFDRTVRFLADSLGSPAATQE